MQGLRRQTIAIGLAFFLGACSTPPAKTTAPVVGTWKIISWETVFPDGTVSYPFMGTKPTGLIVYQPNGLMSVQVMRDPRAPVPASGSVLRATLEEKAAAFSGYYAYWGTYSVNPADRTVSHQITASLWPQEVGITYKRTYDLQGDRLVLTTPPLTIDGRQAFNRLTWQRVSDAATR